MSLGKLKKAELIELAEANDIEVDDDCTKAEIVETLEQYGISPEGEDATESDGDGEGKKHPTKADRQARLKARQ